MIDTAKQIVRRLREAGFTAYYAGGYVRDMLFELHPSDIDIATSAKPDDIERLMPHTISYGKKYGVIVVIENNHHFEIATFRSDSGYSDGRRPDAVYFTDAKEDALRRDFTINGMFYDPIKHEVIDYVDGQQDIKDKLLRFIGEPSQRIAEDKLRMMRAVRFKNTFALEYHDATKKALQEYAHEIINISHERIKQELDRALFHHHRAHYLKDLDEIGLLRSFAPEFDQLHHTRQSQKFHPEGDAFDHALACLAATPLNASLDLIYAVLFHDLGKPSTFREDHHLISFHSHTHEAKKIAHGLMLRLRFPKKQITKILWLVDMHMSLGVIPQMTVAHRRKLFMHPWYQDLEQLFYIDIMGADRDLILYEQVRQLYKQDINIVKKLAPHPLANGNDIMQALSLKPGPQIQLLLDQILDAQIEERIHTKKEALQFAKSIIDQ